jgi:hypothetical protein
MVKVQRLDDAVGPTEVEQPVTPPAIAPSSPAPQNPLSFELARGRGVAVFRMPTAVEVIQTERKIGRLDALENALQKTDFFRHLARVCCESWGDRDAMPPAEKIRSQDDEQAVILMGKLFGEDDAKVEDYCELVEGGHATDPDFDAYLITLRDGTTLKCNEPSQKDNQQRQKAPTSIDGTLRFAAALCSEWNERPIVWSQTIDRLKALPLPDLFRVASALSSFRG